MKVLITGGTGLVGSAIKSILSENENNFIFLSSKDCDLRDRVACEKLFSEGNFDIVVHLASLVAGIYGNISNNYKFFVDNNTMNINIVECCRKYNIKRLINCLSTCIFPEQNKHNILRYPLTSDQILNGRPHPSNSGYATAKRDLYIASKLLSECSDIEIVNLIPTNLLGECDNYHLHDAHIIPAVIHKTYLAQKNNKPLIIKGNGSALREFVYAKDFAKIILKFIDLKLQKQHNSLIVSPPKGNEISIKQVVNNIVKIFDFKGKVIYDVDFENGQHLKTADSSELLQYLPNFKFTLFIEALNNTIKYFIENYDTIRK